MQYVSWHLFIDSQGNATALSSVADPECLSCIRIKEAKHFNPKNGSKLSEI
jgi:hypothetical protein